MVIKCLSTTKDDRLILRDWGFPTGHEFRVQLVSDGARQVKTIPIGLFEIFLFCRSELTSHKTCEQFVELWIESPVDPQLGQPFNLRRKTRGHPNGTFPGVANECYDCIHWVQRVGNLLGEGEDLFKDLSEGD